MNLAPRNRQVQTISAHASNGQMVKTDFSPASADLEQL